MKKTVNTFQKLKNNDEKIAMLTAYDYSTAKILGEAEIDGMLANGVKIQTGTYVGTDRGTGALVPVTLNLNFTPKVVFLQWESGTEADDNQTVSEVYFVQGGNASIVHYVSKSVIANYAPVRVSYTISNNTLTINGAGRNESNSINYYKLTYRYIALGEGV